MTEVYDNRRRRQGDTSGTIRLAASLKDRDGATIPLVSAERLAAARGDSGVYRVGLVLPFQNVAPGRYALQVEAITADGPPIGVSREVNISVK